jgi:DNA-binding FrmR family transcriptional regulator
MKTYQQLINNIIGQLNGIKEMIAQDKDCFDVLVQIKAVKSALTSFTNKFLQENFITCLKEGKESQEDICKKFFTEILKNN